MSYISGAPGNDSDFPALLGRHVHDTDHASSPGSGDPIASLVEEVPIRLRKPILLFDGQGFSYNQARSQRHLNMLTSAIRHELFTLPYYDVFDWLEAELMLYGHVTLRGEVVRPTTANDAEKRVQRLESASNVPNEIKVLPIGSQDDALRIALYRAIYNWNSPLFRSPRVTCRRSHPGGKRSCDFERCAPDGV
jgi:hypothetical protein